MPLRSLGIFSFVGLLFAALASACSGDRGQTHPSAGGTAGEAASGAPGGTDDLPPGPGGAGGETGVPVAGEGGAGARGAGTGGAGTGGADTGGADTGGADAGGADAGGADAECPVTRGPTQRGMLDEALDEASGLAASRINAGVLYTHNDSSAPVYAVDEEGAVVARLVFPGAQVLDWEDIAVGPGPDADRSYLYVGDIGDNDLARSQSIFVQRAREPDLEGFSGEELELEFETLYFRYPDQAHDAEALFVDPRSADLYIVTKDAEDFSEVFVARAPLDPRAIETLERVTTLSFGSENLSGSPLATGAAISGDGARVLLRTYDSAFLWQRGPEASIADALAGTPCRVLVPDEIQGEAIAFAPDGAGYYTTSEGRGAALFFIALE